LQFHGERGQVTFKQTVLIESSKCFSHTTSRSLMYIQKLFRAITNDNAKKGFIRFRILKVSHVSNFFNPMAIKRKRRNRFKHSWLQNEAV